MTEAIVVLCTFPDAAAARQIGTHLVERQYAACASLLPAVESIYQWEGKLCTDAEVMVVFKTTQKKFSMLQSELLDLHPYDVPEVIALPVCEGNPRYLEWLEGQN